MTEASTAPARDLGPRAGMVSRVFEHRVQGVPLLPLATFLIVTVAFMPKALFGGGVFAPLDILEYASPWRDFLATSPHVSTAVQNDGVQSLPVLEAMRSALRHGHWLVWSPYIAGGEPIGALVTTTFQSPFTLLLTILPMAWGLGAVVALRLLFAQTFFYLFLRRFKISIPIATFGAVAYTFCGTNVALLGRVNAYLILPALLWATARVLQRQRPGDVAFLAIASALAWLEGFPGGFVNAVAIDVLMALFVAISSLLRRRSIRSLVRPAASGLALVACGLALSAGLVAVSVLPFERILSASGLVQQRHYNSADHLSPVLLPAMLSVGALGNLHQPSLMPTQEPNGAISGAGNAVELEGGAGLVVVIAAVVGMLLALVGRIRLTRPQRALYAFGLVSVVGGLTLVYFDTPLLALFDDLPFLGTSPANRFRIIINLGFALLACLGIEGFRATRKAAAAESPDTDREERSGTHLPVRVGSGLAILALILMLRDVWPGYVGWLNTPQGSTVKRDLILEAIGGGVVCLLVLGALHLTRRRPHASRLALFGGGLLLALSTFATVAFPIRYFTATVPKSLLFPKTPGHRTLRRLAAQHYRILGSGLGTFYSDTSVYYRYLDLRGLSISTPSFRRLVQGAIPDAYALDHFKVIYDPALGAPINFNSPALDDLGVRYYVGGTNETPLATNLRVKPAVATRSLTARAPVMRVITIRPRVTGFAIPVQRAGACEGSRLQLSVFTPSGRLLATARRPAIDTPTAGAGAIAFTIPVASTAGRRAERVSLGVTGPACRIAAGVDRAGRLDTSLLIEPPDGLPIVADDEGVFYERPRAHPVVWSTTRWRPTRNAAQALQLATVRGRRPGDPVPVSDAGQPSAQSGTTGKIDHIRYVSDGFDVDSQTTGASLIATGFAGSSTDWSVQVDSRRARLASVDGALLGTRVDAGRHTESFRYDPPDLGVGAAISGISVLALVALVIAESRRSRLS